MLVFCQEPWHALNMKGCAINERIQYTLAKWGNELVLVADKRLGELQMRSGKEFKKIMVLDGSQLEEITVQSPLGQEVPVLVDNEVTPFHGSGINMVSPAHDIHSLRLSYIYGLPKDGVVDDNGKLDQLFEGDSVFDE